MTTTTKTKTRYVRGYRGFVIGREITCHVQPCRIAQSVTCLTTDACLTADPGDASVIRVRSHTFMEIDHEIISTVILLPSADALKKGCCQPQSKVCPRSSSLPRKKEWLDALTVPTWP